MRTYAVRVENETNRSSRIRDRNENRLRSVHVPPSFHPPSRRRRADGHHVRRVHAEAVRGHQVDPALRVLHHVLGAADEDLAGVAHVPRQVRAQAEAHRQTAAAVDDAHTDGRAGVHGRVDVQRPAARRAGEGRGRRAQVLAVLQRLVGLLSGGR